MSEQQKPTKWEYFALLTRRSRDTLRLGQEEARSMGHLYFGAEHLLLGLLRVESDVAYRALSSLGVNLADTRSRVEQMVGRNVRKEGLKPSETGQLPFTPRMKEALTQTVLESQWLDHDRHIGTEHLLLGLGGAGRRHGGEDTRRPRRDSRQGAPGGHAKD
jgi:ATP-dependent Clp protease ATP-binding subunit ClpA